MMHAYQIPIHYEPLCHNAKMAIHTKHYLKRTGVFFARACALRKCS